MAVLCRAEPSIRMRLLIKLSPTPTDQDLRKPSSFLLWLKTQWREVAVVGDVEAALFADGLVVEAARHVELGRHLAGGHIHALDPGGRHILAPGERITRRILDYIAYAKEKGCQMTGPEDPAIEKLNVVEE